MDIGIESNWEVTCNFSNEEHTALSLLLKKIKFEDIPKIIGSDDVEMIDNIHTALLELESSMELAADLTPDHLKRQAG